MEITLRKEIEADYRRVEEVTREAFWNLYVPGCCEHYLAHVMRAHRDFLPALDYVAVLGDQIVGNIMYTKSKILNEQAETADTLTFGPVSVLPAYQRQGIGSALIQHTLQKAKTLGYPAIIIYGSPHNYCKHGFKSCKDYQLSTMAERYPYSLLVLELKAGTFDNHSWKYQESEVYDVDVGQAEVFDQQFEYKEKEYRYTQEAFKIACQAYLE